MKKLVALLVILAICLPSYGTILVYKTTLKVNPAASRGTDDPNVGWVTGSLAAKAYMVLDVNLADPNAILDANSIQDAALIPYGKGPDANDVIRKVYVDDAVLDIFLFSVLDGLQLANGKFKPDIFLIDFTADNVAAERVGAGIVDARIQGPTKLTFISPTVKQNVPTSPKGVAIYDSLYDDTLAGSGTFAASIDSTNTKRANDPLVFNGVFADVVAGLKRYLGDKGYTPVLQTP